MKKLISKVVVNHQRYQGCSSVEFGGVQSQGQDPQAMMPTKMRHIRTDPRSRMVDLSASYSAILNILRLFGYFSLGNSIGGLLEYR